MKKHLLPSFIALCLLAVSLGTSGCRPSSVNEDPTTSAPAEELTETAEPSKENKPVKYFTLSFDDGITQDLRLIELLKKYDVKCCSFNINTGLFGVEWESVGSDHNRPDVTHIRFTEEQIRAGIYDGFDVQVHALTHATLKEFDDDIEGLKREINGDADNIEAITGTRPIGMAWPGNDGFYTDTTIDLILEHTDIRFARGTTSTYGFDLPEHFMKWMPTCSVVDTRVLMRARSFINAEAEEDMLFYVWGHSYDLDIHNKWDTFEELLRMMTEAEDICFITTTDFYHLYKDRIPA